MRSIRRRGIATTRSGGAKRVRRSANLGLAMLIALIAMAIAAGAASAAGPGVNGPNLVTSTDTTPLGYTQPTGYTAPADDGLGVPAGTIKHVWLIVMENHAYETNFTGLNNNSYLSKTLPAAGAELTHYYGTGHSSLDNYLSLTSGQAPQTDDQGDCPAYTSMAGMTGAGYTGGISTSGTLTSNGDYGQFASAAGPNAPAGDNGCVYPSTVPTLFNQLDAKGDSWKVYAQDSSIVGARRSELPDGDERQPRPRDRLCRALWRPGRHPRRDPVRRPVREPERREPGRRQRHVNGSVRREAQPAAVVRLGLRRLQQLPLRDGVRRHIRHPGPEPGE